MLPSANPLNPPQFNPSLLFIQFHPLYPWNYQTCLARSGGNAAFIATVHFKLATQSHFMTASETVYCHYKPFHMLVQLCIGLGHEFFSRITTLLGLEYVPNDRVYVCMSKCVHECGHKWVCVHTSVWNRQINFIKCHLRVYAWSYPSKKVWMTAGHILLSFSFQEGPSRVPKKIIGLNHECDPLAPISKYL